MLKVFGWRMMLNRLPTRDHLARRGILHSAHENACILCFEEEENLSHMFFQCRISTRIWNKVYQWMEMKVLMETECVDNYIRFINALQENCEEHEK